ncbi:MAG: hypothetical protein QOI67_2007, partial [Gaiellaceae bacterium]|nr:hypothetical protein [Gaiellaceae bacterium]
TLATSALRHRGPDDTGFWFSEGVALGQTRLSIIDVAGGNQPMLSEDEQVVVVYNGEIWNYLQLRDELGAAGHRFATRSDTEVLVHGYEEWGTALLDRLDGMFAFAIWDRRAQRLFLARDRVGKKPLYVTRTSGGVAFGSDARAVLVAAGLEPKVDRRHVAEFLFQRYVISPATMFEGVKKLQAGSFALHDRSGGETQSYWSVSPSDGAPVSAGGLRDLLRDAVSRRLMSDVPLGILLSGGVDSAAVLGLMREAGAESIASFTIGFDDPRYDERSQARIAADTFQTDHHEIVVGESRFVDALPRLAWYRDEPIAEPSEVPLLLLAELAGAHVKVVLTGDGGDELFAGYPKYRADRFASIVSRLPRIAAAASLVSGTQSHRRLERAVETLAVRDPLLRWASWFRSFSPAELQSLLAPEFRAAAEPRSLAEPLREALAPYEGLDQRRRMLLGDFRTYLVDNMLLRGDKVLMAASVEGRTPLLDRRIVESVAALRVTELMRGRTSKVILRSAVADLVPPDLLRQPKRGFPVPVASLVAGDRARVLQQLLLSDRALDRGLFVPEKLRQLVAEGGTRAGERDLKLFTLASLELWFRVNVDQVRLAPPEGWADVLDTDAGAYAA